ncbi:hypothetical protein KFL_001240240 [Klebsormidium nitens]|uniref:Uncharacterized protein n=1 Tax=Klebsormidium nitens TaxID=105231 RepID=A0A1Y1HXB6_KLENI|nr:hypothetical protein KFL_001240240 [Klebsormidium nitens]|eukprot:GAQ82793.1 hypothetical protein KFL_001240240 [Klebsormidium nitens]
MWNPRDDPQGRRNSPIFKMMNPELHMKPNMMVAAVGTTLFVVIMGSLLWEKHKYEQQQAKLRQSAVERVIKEE